MAGLFGGKGIGMMMALLAVAGVGGAAAVGMMGHSSTVPTNLSGYGSMACQATSLSGSVSKGFSGSMNCHVQMVDMSGMMGNGMVGNVSGSGYMNGTYACQTAGTMGSNGTPVQCTFNGSGMMNGGMGGMSGDHEMTLAGTLLPGGTTVTGTMSCAMSMGSGSCSNGGPGGPGGMGNGMMSGQPGPDGMDGMTWTFQLPSAVGR